MMRKEKPSQNGDRIWIELRQEGKGFSVEVIHLKDTIGP